MAALNWVGRSPAVAQVGTATVGGTAAAAQVYAVRLGDSSYGPSIAYTAVGGDTNSTIAAALKALLAASEYPEFLELTWTVASAVITYTATTPGKPHTITTTATGTGTFVSADTTAASGPNFWSTGANWDTGSAPVDSDTVTVDRGPSILYGLSNTSIDLAALTVTPTFTASYTIGLPPINVDDPDYPYPEYRTQRLKLGTVTTLKVETTSPRVRLDTGTNACAATVNGTGVPYAGERALDLVGSHASNSLNLNKGSVGVATYGGDAANFPTVNVAYLDDQDADADVWLGPGMSTITTLGQSGGVVRLECAVTTLNRDGGTLDRLGSGAVTTVNNRAGTFEDEGTGTIATLNNAAEYYKRGLSALTITNCNVYGSSPEQDSVTDDPAGKVVWSNGIVMSNCHLPISVTDPGPRPAYVRVGMSRTLTIA